MMGIGITKEDLSAAELLGATGVELVERAIHSALDRAGIPREGRTVTVTRETIRIDLPPGWVMPGED
jgi:hypothetical protein